MKQLHLLLAFVFGGSMSQLFPGEKFPIKENPNGLNYDMYPGIMDPTEDPENEKLPVTGPLLRPSYWARMYKGPNCTDPFPPEEGSHANFGCTERCYGVGPTRSILLQAEFWGTFPGETGSKSHRFVEEWRYRHRLRPSRMASEGPVAFAFGWDCTPDKFVKKIVIPAHKRGTCYTFAEGDAVHRFYLRMQRLCDDSADSGEPPASRTRKYDFWRGSDEFRQTVEGAPPRVDTAAIKEGVFAGDLEVVYEHDA